jgi:phosphate transport system substrate-binding protein
VARLRVIQESSPQRALRPPRRTVFPPAPGWSVRIVALSVAALAFAPVAPRETITIKGSDTMVILGQRWAEAYMKRHPGVIVQVTAGGSGTGIAALITGGTDICFASRPLSPREQERLQRRFGTQGVAVRCAIDGLSIYVHPSNPLPSLTFAQIKGVYTGAITTWQELNGPPRAIVLYGRENNSGTYVYLQNEILEGEAYAEGVLRLPGTAAVVNAVAHDSAGIGYGGAAYSKGIREIAVRRDELSPAYEPTLENVQRGLYPISRFLYLYLRSRPEGELKGFVDWILSDEGQAIVRDVGYFPLR